MWFNIIPSDDHKMCFKTLKIFVAVIPSHLVFYTTQLLVTMLHLHQTPREKEMETNIVLGLNAERKDRLSKTLIMLVDAPVSVS